MTYQVFTDGSSSRNRKTIGTSYIIFKNRESEPIRTFCKGFKDEQARNGIAELLGVYYFLRDLCVAEDLYIEEKSEIVIYSDSQYVVNEFTEWFRNQMMKNFFDTKNKEIIIYILWMLHILRQEGFKIKFEWIRGHQKKESFEVFGNNWADSFACQSHDKIVCSDNMRNIEEVVKNLREDIEEEGILQIIRKIYLGI